MASAQERNTYVKNQNTTTQLKRHQTKLLTEITVSTLVNEAQVARASFYRNYESLEDIIAQYDQKLINEWAKKFESTHDSELHNVLASLFQHYKEHEDFYMMLYRNDLTYLIRDTICRRIGPQPEMNDNERYCLKILAYGIYGWIREWMSRGMNDIPEDLNEIFPNGLIL